MERVTGGGVDLKGPTVFLEVDWMMLDWNRPRNGGQERRSKAGRGGNGEGGKVDSIWPSD